MQVQIVKPYNTRSDLKLVFTKLVQIVKPYKTRSNLFKISVYKTSEAIWYQS